MNWNVIRKDLSIVAAIIIAIIAILNWNTTTEVKASTLGPTIAFKSGPTFTAIITVKTTIFGKTNSGLTLNCKSATKTAFVPGGITMADKNNKAHYETTCVIPNLHEGDEVIVEVMRAVALATPSKRRMALQSYTLSQSIPNGHEAFTDPNGFGEGMIFIQLK